MTQVTAVDPAAPGAAGDPPLAPAAPRCDPAGRDPARRDPVGRDLVGRAERLRHDLATRLTALVRPADDAGAGGRGGDGGSDGDALAGGDVSVGWHAALAVRSCAARYRAGGEEGWGFPGWSAPTAAAAVGRAALHRHLDDDPPLGIHPLPHPLALVKDWMRATRPAPDRGVAEWVADRLEARDAPTLAATAAGAARWVAGFVRVLGWPLPDGLALLGGGRDGAVLYPWRPWKRAPVAVRSGADARLGRVTGSGDFAVVVHRPTTGADGTLRDRAAFEATAAALSIGVVPARVVVTAGDTGERARVDVDGALLDAGAALVEDVVRQRVIATERGFAAEDATPSAACRRCELLAGCGPGRAWLDGPGRWRGGLPSR